MFLLNKNAKAALLSLGLGIGLLSSASAQTTFKLSLIAGGSSALQGDYRPATFAPGAMPRVIAQLSNIAGYKIAGQQERVLVVTSANTTVGNTANITVRYDRPPFLGGGTVDEVVTDAMIRFVDDGAGSTNVIVLLRSDSGQGIRYAANNGRIVNFPDVATRYSNVVNNVPVGLTSFTDAAFVVSGAPNAGNIATFLRGAAVPASGIQIDSGVSDVSADSIIRYVPELGVNPTGVGTTQIEQFNLPIITLLPLYNNNVHTQSGTDFKVNFTKTQFRNLIAGAPDTDGGAIRWNKIDPRLPNFTATAVYRENSSGTRVTELLDIQRVTFDQALIENQFSSNINPNANPGFVGTVNPNPQTGTGNMLGTLNNGYNPGTTAGSTKTATVGYSFVTGNAGAGRANIRVGLYNGVAPFRAATSSTFAATDGTALPVPAEADYTTFATAGLPFYSETANGRWELWTVPITIQRKSLQTVRRPTLNSIINSLNNPSAAFQLIVNGAGFVQTVQMNAFRAGFISPITGEYVTDGMLINYDTTTSYNPPAPGLVVTDPNGILQ